MSTLKAYCRDFWRYRFLLKHLIGRDFKLKYRRSVLGVVWSVLNPLLMMLVMWFVFSNIMDMRAGGIENFPVYLLSGQLMFGFFSEATSSSMGSVLGAAPLMKKVYLPKYIFPLEKVCFSFVNTMFSFVALVLVMIITGAKAHATLPLFIFPMVTLFVFTLGVSLFLAALTVFFRDIIHLWGVFITLLTYFSAIFYNPAAFDPWFYKAIKFNPVYWYITAFRNAILDGVMFSRNTVLVCTLCAVVSLVIGLAVFKAKQDKFVLYL